MHYLTFFHISVSLNCILYHLSILQFIISLRVFNLLDNLSLNFKFELHYYIFYFIMLCFKYPCLKLIILIVSPNASNVLNIFILYSCPIIAYLKLFWIFLCCSSKLATWMVYNIMFTQSLPNMLEVQ